MEATPSVHTHPLRHPHHTGLTFDFVATDRPPEQGWEPFLDWLRSQGVDPFLCRALHVTGEGQADVVEYLLDDHGRRYCVDGDVAVATRRVSLSGPPPLHPSRGAA
jgi:hypothetical protein